MFRLHNDVILAAELCSHPVNDAIIMNVYFKRMGKKLVVYLEEINRALAEETEVHRS
jgi:hypothetical protein